MTRLRPAALVAVAAAVGVVALYAFGAGANVGSGPTSHPTTQPRSAQPTASTDDPDAPLGAWDLDAFEGRFGVEFSPNDLTASSNIAYDADLDPRDSPFTLSFTVDPNDPHNAIVGTGIRSRLPHNETGTEDEWLAFIADTRPDVAEWLKSKRDNYLAAPGAVINLAEWFGGLCAGLITAASVFEPAADATYLYMWAQYEVDCP